MTLSKKIRTLSLAASLLVPASLVVAEDIDLYQGGSAITGNKPNVLIILDNSANWSTAKQDWTDGGKQGDAELTAISDVINAVGSDVRIGLMMFTKGGGGEYDGGFVRYAIRDMDTGNKNALKTILHNIRDIAGITNSDQKVMGALYSNAFYETYQYFKGGTRYSAKDAKIDWAGNGSPTLPPYTAGSLSNNAFTSSAATQYISPLSALSPCSKNFVIFIGNDFPSGDIASAPNLPRFNDTQVYATNDGERNFADEWTRYLKNVGVPGPCTTDVLDDPTRVCADGSITTYTIDVYKAKPNADQNRLLKSMAKVGGGEYFAATSKDEIVSALQSIFNQIQAVNSVFASSSLPVSVNTQGTYLNQIYMGVFRPDINGKQRWLGNLKQYKFKITTDATGTETLVLADADDVAAVSSTTGFIKSDARSYWTSDSTFWTKIYSTAEQSDNPDGALVEKGAAAQRLRTQATNPALTSARKVLTCIPNCVTGETPALFHTDNAHLTTAMVAVTTRVDFSRNGPTVTATSDDSLGLVDGTPESVTISGSAATAYNGSWLATKTTGNTFTFTIPETPATPATGTITVSSGTSTTQIVPGDTTTSNMTYSNGTVSVNLTSHGFVTGQAITIAGANISAGMSTAGTKCSGWGISPLTNCEYNGTFNVNVVDANNFTYTLPTSNFGYSQTFKTEMDPPESITAGFTTLTCKDGGSTIMTKVANSTVTRVAGGVANNTRRITVRLASVPASCASPLTNVNNAAKRIIALALTGTNSETLNQITHSNTIFYGNACGYADSYCFDVILKSKQVVDETIPIVPVSPAKTADKITASGLPTRNVTSITRTAGNVDNIATVTLKTSGPHLFSISATEIFISGANQAEYNGTKTTGAGGNALSLADPSGNTITFTIATGPAASGNGVVAKGANTVPAATLINWMRGVDNKDDENSDGSLADVRASIHGDVLHSRPAIVNYGARHGGTNDAPTIVAFYGANDGTLRAVKGGQADTDGTEKWAFVAPEHKDKWSRLYANSPRIRFSNMTDETAATITPTPIKRDYFFDGNIGVHQSLNPLDNELTTHIFAGMRRGGRAIYAFDVSNPDTPKFLWTRSNLSITPDASGNAPTINGHASFAEMGQTWSTPKVIPIKKTAGTACSLNNAASYTRALVFGAGYDANEEDKLPGVKRSPAMGRGVFVLNAETGELIKLLQPADEKKYSFAADVTLMDSDNDGCVDRLYAVDTGANIFRFDIGDPAPANWATYKIAALGDTGDDGGSDDRKFLYAPDPVMYSNGTDQQTFLMVGSGDREAPRSTSIKDLFFMVKDRVPAPVNDVVPAFTVANVDTTNTSAATNLLTKVTNFNSATTSLNTTTVMDAAFEGWYIEYEAGEKTVNAPVTISGITYFGTNLPKAPDAMCTPNLGTARGYAVNFLTGTSGVGDRNANGVIDQTDLYSNLVGGGLPPSPVAGTVCIGDNCKRFCIGCGGTEKNSSAIEASKVHATPDPRRKRVYWYYKKDQ